MPMFLLQVIMMGVVSYFVYQRAGAIHANVQVDVKQFSGLVSILKNYWMAYHV